MKIEHIAYVVRDSAATADWYVKHLGFTILRSGPPPNNARFLADTARCTVIEIYFNASVSIPDYASMDPLVTHLALVSEDIHADRGRLIKAGASPIGEVSVTDSGDTMAMLRDPWGFPLQLMKRAQPML